MAVVRCLQCKKRYDPGIDEELAGLDDMLDVHLKVVCPGCGQWMRFPENVAIPTPPVPLELIHEMMSQSRLIEGEAETTVADAPAKMPWWKIWKYRVK